MSLKAKSQLCKRKERRKKEKEQVRVNEIQECMKLRGDKIEIKIRMNDRKDRLIKRV